MKKLLFFLFALITLVSCSSNSDDEVIIEPENPGQPTFNIFDALNLDQNDFSVTSVKEDDNIHFLWGIKKSDNTSLVGIYDDNKNQQVIYNSKDVIPDTLKVFKGYGEYETFLRRAGLNDYFNINNCYIYNVEVNYYSYLWPTDDHLYYNKLFRYDGNNIKESKSYSHSDFDSKIREWYNNSIALNQAEHPEYTEYGYIKTFKTTILNNDLDSITSYKRLWDIDSTEVPVDYDKSILLWNPIRKYNYSQEKDEWVSEDLLKKYDISKDAKLTLNVITKNNNIWNIKLHAILFDGTAEDKEFTLNIDTGEIK